MRPRERGVVERAGGVVRVWSGAFLFFGVVNQVLVRSWARRTTRLRSWDHLCLQGCRVVVEGSVDVMRDCLTGRDRGSRKRIKGRPADDVGRVQGRWIKLC